MFRVERKAKSEANRTGSKSRRSPVGVAALVLLLILVSLRSPSGCLRRPFPNAGARGHRRADCNPPCRLPRLQPCPRRLPHLQPRPRRPPHLQLRPRRLPHLQPRPTATPAPTAGRPPAPTATPAPEPVPEPVNEDDALTRAYVGEGYRLLRSQRPGRYGPTLQERREHRERPVSVHSQQG